MKRELSVRAKDCSPFITTVREGSMGPNFDMQLFPKILGFQLAEGEVYFVIGMLMVVAPPMYIDEMSLSCNWTFSTDYVDIEMPPLDISEWEDLVLGALRVMQINQVSEMKVYLKNTTDYEWLPNEGKLERNLSRMAKNCMKDYLKT